jgi:uncharacterized BrkB/YihY/UPF0761 family membrane protein
VKVSEMEARESKTLVDGDPMKEPSWPLWTLTKAFRIVLLTVLWTGLGMGVGLFCGIFGMLAAGAIQHRTPDMSMAYRYISIPAAVCSGSCAFIWNAARAAQAAARKRMK